jgi:hypothetical protein
VRESRHERRFNIDNDISIAEQSNEEFRFSTLSTNFIEKIGFWRKILDLCV